MSAFIQKAAVKYGKKYATERIVGMTPDDPYYEYRADAKGRQKRFKRDVPPGLSKRDEKALRKIRKRAHYLDKGMNLCGFRVGWTFWVGIVPGLGDVVDVTLNYTLVVRPATKLDLPTSLTSHMFFNNAVSAGVGLVPFIGDVALAAWKANWRNAHALEAFLAVRGLDSIKAAYLDPTFVPPGGAFAHPEVLTSHELLTLAGVQVPAHTVLSHAVGDGSATPLASAPTSGRNTPERVTAPKPAATKSRWWGGNRQGAEHSVPLADQAAFSAPTPAVAPAVTQQERPPLPKRRS